MLIPHCVPGPPEPPEALSGEPASGRAGMERSWQPVGVSTWFSPQPVGHSLSIMIRPRSRHPERVAQLPASLGICTALDAPAM